MPGGWIYRFNNDKLIRERIIPCLITRRQNKLRVIKLISITNFAVIAKIIIIMDVSICILYILALAFLPISPSPVGVRVH